MVSVEIISEAAPGTEVGAVISFYNWERALKETRNRVIRKQT
jgi:hypothetical protein